MHLDYTPGQKALRDELRAYFGRLMTPTAISPASAERWPAATRSPLEDPNRNPEATRACPSTTR